MPTGLNRSLTADEINRRAGTIAKDLNEAMNDVGNLKIFFDTWDDTALAAYGLSTDDITTLRAVVTDLNQIRNLYLGGQTLTVAYDHRTFARRIWGFGF
jgi:hypothetical protein